MNNQPKPQSKYDNLSDDALIAIAECSGNPFLRAAAERLKEMNQIIDEAKRRGDLERRRENG